VATQDGELPDGDELARVVDAAKGLTRSEAENTYLMTLPLCDGAMPGPSPMRRLTTSFGEWAT